MTWRSLESNRNVSPQRVSLLLPIFALCSFQAFVRSSSIVSCVCLSPYLSADEPSSRKPSEAKVQEFQFELHARDVATSGFDLGVVNAGSMVKAVVVLTNKTGKPLSLESVTASCSCTTATVPQKTVESDSIEALAFAFQIPKTPRTLKDSFRTSITTKGVTQSIHFIFRAAFSDVVGFVPADFVHIYDSSKPESQFQIQLLLSDLDSTKSLRAEVSPELVGLQTSIVRMGDKAAIQCKFRSDAFKSDSATGELRLFKPKDSEPSTLRCSLQRELPIRVMPDRLVFTPSVLGDGSIEATGMIKVRTSRETEHLVRGVTCKLHDTVKSDFKEKSVELKFNRIGLGLYRVHLNFKDPIDAFGDSQIKDLRMTWSIESDLAPYVAETELFRAN